LLPTESINTPVLVIIPSEAPLKDTIIIYDTNFFVSLIENTKSFDELIDFINELKSTLVENNITTILPFQVVAELGGFDPNLVTYLEINFKVHPPVDITKDKFFLNLRWINSQRKHDLRWFNTEEITDLEIITVAKETYDEFVKKKGMPPPEIIIVSNDEGIQKASEFFLKDIAKVQESAPFLGFLYGISDKKDVQERMENMSKRMFKYFTRYRLENNRRPIRSIDNFFADMLNSIRLAREDIEPQFGEEVIKSFEKYIITHEQLAPDLLIYESSLVIIKQMLAVPDAQFLNIVDAKMHELFLKLNALVTRMNEPQDYTRFYNYLSIYLVRIHLNAFKICFFWHDLDLSTKHMALAKLAAQAMINQPGANRLYYSILMVETAYCIITGAKDDAYVASSINFLADALKRRKVPALIPPDQVNMLIAIYSCIKEKRIDILNTKGVNCELNETSLRCPKEYFSILLVLVEDFCDELTSFGNHQLALKVLSHVHGLLENGSDEDIRIEGKIYLICLILGAKIPEPLAHLFPGDWERTKEPLENAIIRNDFARIETVDAAFKKGIKVLTYNHEGKFFICWIYPLKSRFKVIIPNEINITAPERLKDFKVLAGSIKINKPDEKERKDLSIRGIIELDRECTIQPFYYQDKFFTLNLI